MLQKAGYTFDGSVLTIFAGRKFAKTQLDKALSTLSGALTKAGQPDATITILADPKPPADSQTAAVLAIMGGGEEVNLEEVS